MRIEEWRRKFMDEPFQWGDSPPGIVTCSGRDMKVSCKDWSIDSLVAEGKRFQHVSRRSAASPDLQSFISQHEHSGVPFIIEDCHKSPKWSPDLSIERFTALIKQDSIVVRNCANGGDLTVPLDTFIAKSRTIETTAVPGETERLYGKDAPCPPEWCDWLTSSGVVPSCLLPNSSENLLLNSQSQRVETLMCYLGIGDTYTSMHKDLCASSGQNLMCYAENGGSSFWFMTESSAARRMSNYFHNFKQELDHETHVITLKQLARAPCTVYIAQQKLGDLVFVPPRSCHQVVNSGGITIKTSWSRMTLQGLRIALYHELPIYRRVCRPEIYRVRSTIHHTLILFTSKLNSIPPSDAADTHVSQLLTTLELFDRILVEEYSKDSESMPRVVTSHSDGSNCPISCDFCGADIFQSFFECRTCSKSSESQDLCVGDGYAICAGCYVEGRSCRCFVMEPVQYRRFGDLLADRKAAVDALTSRLEASGTTVKLKSEEQLLCGNDYTMIFTAGCILRKRRLSNKQKAESKRICNLSERHEERADSSKNCQKCHSAACYGHSLNSRKIHSLEVLLASEGDKGDEFYHSIHVQTKARYEQGLDKFRQTQAAGDVPDFLVQLVDLAISFKTCKPINPEFMRPGWYDEYTQLTGSEKQRVAELLPVRPLSTEPPSDPEPEPVASPEVSSETLALSAGLPEVSIPTEAAPLTSVSISSQKRKRLLIDYVDVPPAEYRSATAKHPHTQSVGLSSMQASSTLSNMKTKLVCSYVLMPPVPAKYRRSSPLRLKESKSSAKQSAKIKHIASTALPARQAQFDPKTRTVVTIADKRPGSALPTDDERRKKKQRLSHSQTPSKLLSPQSLPLGLKFKKNGTPSTTDEGAAGLVAAYTTAFAPTPSSSASFGVSPAPSPVPHLPTNDMTSLAESFSLPSIPYPPASPEVNRLYEARIHNLNLQVEELRKKLKEMESQLQRQPYPHNPPTSPKSDREAQWQIRRLNRQVAELTDKLKVKESQLLRQSSNDQQARHQRFKQTIPTEPRNRRRAGNPTDPSLYEHQPPQLHIHYHIHEGRNMTSRNHTPSSGSIRRRVPPSARPSLADRIASADATRNNRLDVQAPLSLAERIGEIATTSSSSDDEDSEPDGEKIVRNDGRSARSEQMSKPEPSTAKPVDQFGGDGNHGSSEHDRELDDPVEFDEPEEVRAASRGSSPVSMWSDSEGA